MVIKLFQSDVPLLHRPHPEYFFLVNWFSCPKPFPFTSTHHIVPVVLPDLDITVPVGKVIAYNSRVIGFKSHQMA